jgi:HNH endonuclease
MDDEFARRYPTTANRDLAARYQRSVVTILKWARRMSLRKDANYRRAVQSINASKRRLTTAQRERMRQLALGRTMSAETKAKIVRTKRARGTLLRGPAHPFWKGGRPWQRFKDPAYVTWRNAVLARDGYRCQRCGRQCKKHEKGLAAHHIAPYKTNPDLRLDVANGLTLCRQCHMALHGRSPRPAPLIACACGCGALIASVDRYGRPRRYVNHHAGRHPKSDG